LVAFLFVASLLSIDPSRVSKVNKLKSEAKTAYLAGDMKTAIVKYQFLVDSLHVDEDEVEMNLANAYFNLNDTSNALTRYQPLSVSGDSKINSQANQQMGVVANRQGKFEEALNYFKQAMKAEPNNEQARYNYEMVKKKLEEQKKKEQQDKDKNNQDKKDDQKKDQNKDQKDQQNKDQKDKQDQKDKKDQDQKKDQKDKQDQKDKEQKDKEQKEKEQQKKNQPDDKKNEKKDKQDPSLSEKLKDMKISEEKAKMILEAMKNQEVQYLQQNKRKATKPKDKGKPDW